MSSLRLLSRSNLHRHSLATALTTSTTTITTSSTSSTSSSSSTARPLLPLLLRPYSSAFQSSPSPPRLPAEQQAEFERLQRAVADRFADPTPLPHEQPAPSPANTSRHTTTPGGGEDKTAATVAAEAAVVSSAEKDGTAETPAVLTGGVWRGAKPDFEGETNPKTGEVGGPKTEPLRWGSGGDWSYNGRVTDF